MISTTVPLGPLTLEVDNGDNAPLDLGSAYAIIRVPRIVFKTAAGTFRLLLGNERAEAPRYDLAGLRREMLAYSAVAAGAGGLTGNKAAKETWFSGLQTFSRSALVWGAIVAAMVVLLGLTLRTIRSA
jgi:hypothetical protein